MKQPSLVAAPASGARRALVFGSVLALLAGIGYLIFELGRYQANYSVLDAREERIALNATIAELEDANEALRRRVAILETSSDVDQEAYAQVESSLGELQEEIRAKEKELAFYRGIVSPADGRAGLRIQTLELNPVTGSEQLYQLRLVLVQAMKQDRRISGVVLLNFVGEQDGEPARLALRDLQRDGESAEIAFSFRFFQDFEEELMLPAGFVPATVEVEVRPKGRNAKVMNEVFPWPSELLSEVR